MSIQAVAWALELEIPDALAKLVLVSLANHADHKTGRAYPTLETVCKEASSARRTVQEKIRWLEKKRLLRIVADHDPKTGRQRANSYFLRLGIVNADIVTLNEAETLITQGMEPGEGAPDAPSLFDGGGGCAVAHGEDAPGRMGEGAPACTPNKEPSEGNRQKETDSHPLPSPRGGAKIVFDPLKKGALLERACQAIAGEGGNDVGAIGQRLEAAGFAVEFTATVHDRGDGRAGRIPLLARKGLATVAIALDRDTIGPKDLAKLTSGISGLAAGAVGYRVGVLAKMPPGGGVDHAPPLGLEALVVLEAPKPAPAAIWIEADTAAWRIACEELGHKPTLHSPSSEHGGRRGWLFRAASFKPETLERLT